MLPDLYRRDGAYAYTKGTNGAAIVATVVGCVLAWIGLVVEPLRVLYDYAWFVGAFGAAGTYAVLMLGKRDAVAAEAVAATRSV